MGERTAPGGLGGEMSSFGRALSDFTGEVAWGGALRHLADLGYTAKQISAKLDYPVPYEIIRTALTAYLRETGVLLAEEPLRLVAKERAEYVREYGQYGQTSYRRVVTEEKSTEKIRWREETAVWMRDGALVEKLDCAVRENGERFSYVACPFGCPDGPGREALDKAQREYLDGILWEPRPMYHRLTPRMREITLRLAEAGEGPLTCYFLKTEYKLEIRPNKTPAP